MGTRVPVVQQQYSMRSAADSSYIGSSCSLHDLNTGGEMEGGLGEVDRDEAVTEEEEDDSLDNVEESSAVDCIHEPYRNSLPLHSVGVEEDRSTLENNGSSRDPYDVLTTDDVAPIENARARFLDIIVDHFISSHIIEAPDSEGDYTGQTAQDKLSKRKIREMHYEGDARFVLPLMYVANMYETLVNEVNIRLSSVNVFRGKTIGVALEASGGLYRKIAKKFPRKGTCIFKRRELATSFETRSRFPELVIQEEKRVRFVVVNGLSIVEKPNSMHIEDAEWFKRLTGRHEVAVSARDYKFYSPRHKYRRASSNSLPSISGLSTFAGTDNSSPMATGQGYRSVNEPQNQQQTPSKHHLEPLLHHPQFHPLHHNHQQPIQQTQHAAQFSHNHQCGPPSHLPGIAHVQQSATISQHMACLHPLSGGHVGGRLHVLVCFLWDTFLLLFYYRLLCIDYLSWITAGMTNSINSSTEDVLSQLSVGLIGIYRVSYP